MGVGVAVVEVACGTMAVVGVASELSSHPTWLRHRLSGCQVANTPKAPAEAFRWKQAALTNGDVGINNSWAAAGQGSNKNRRSPRGFPRLYAAGYREVGEGEEKKKARERWVWVRKPNSDATGEQ